MSDIPHSPFHPIFDGIEMGIGTWSWGDRMLWGFGKDYTEEDIHAAYDVCRELGVFFFDTAEVYGRGRSEEFLGDFTRNHPSPAIIASKFYPFPWRLTRNSLVRALNHTLSRLNISCLDLYQLQFPYPPITIETWMEAMAGAYQAGLVRAIGICNCQRQDIQRAYNYLIQQGIRLASHQVEYNLLNRTIEHNGVMSLCNDLGIKIIAYSPLSMGLLTGKYSEQNPPHEMIGRGINRDQLSQMHPLIQALKRIGTIHDIKDPAQIAINWVICKGALPIPGVKNAIQARQNCTSVGWRLSVDEVMELDEISARITQQP